MAHKIAVASSKGGVGKTTTAVSLGHALSAFGREIIVVDANLEQPNVGLQLGYEHTPKSLHGAMDGDCAISDSTYLHPSGLRIVPGDCHCKKQEKHDHDTLFDLLTDFHNKCEVLLIDAPSAPIKKMEDVLRHVDSVLLVTTADHAALHESKQTADLARKVGCEILGVVITKHRESEYGIDAKHIETTLSAPVIGIIPYSEDVLEAVAHKHPVTYTHTDADVSVAYKRLAANLLGQKYVANVEKEEPEPLADAVLKRLGFR